VSLADLDLLDVMSEDVVEFNQKGCRVRIEASKFGRPFWIVPDGDRFTRAGEAVFHASEIRKLMEYTECAFEVAMIKSKFPVEIGEIVHAR
jgi:hypothetical protein